MKVSSLTKIALFACLLAIGANININTPFLVPFTLQVFVLSIIAHTLEPKEAMFTVVIYIIIGLIGLPVFAQGTGGIATVLLPSFGFLVGFIPATYLLSTISNKSSNKITGFIFGTLVFVVVLYSIALPYLYMIVTQVLGGNLTFSKLIVSYFLIFIPTDLLSHFIGYVVSIRLKKSKIL